jgi:predicted amidophosphoribosyltransferase
VADCPNCGADVPEGERLCPNCGFDTGESQAEDVRRLREEGRIHPGRLGPTDAEEYRPATERSEDLEAGEEVIDPRETEGGL